MKQLRTHYDNLYRQAVSEIRTDQYDLDQLIDSKQDKRFGITLIIRPPLEVKQRIQLFLNELKAVDPNQYYYPDSDIHITVMSIISCYEGFDIHRIELSDYKQLIKTCIPKKLNIKIQFKGVTAANSCIMLRGFMNNEQLNMIRNDLRIKFKNSSLEQSLDKRYAIQTAHATIVRFRDKITNKQEYLRKIDEYVHYDFGTFEVDKIFLVYNDWYQRNAFVVNLHDF